METVTIRTHALLCVFCKAPAAADGYIHKAVVVAGDKLHKATICSSCIEQKKEHVYCYWRRRLKASNRREIMDTRRLLAIFEKLCRADDRRDSFKLSRYLLALLLFRRKKIRLTNRVQAEGVKTLCFQLPSGDAVCVEELDLSEEEIKQKTDEFMKFLEDSNES